MRNTIVLIMAYVSWSMDSAAGTPIAIKNYDVHHAVLSGFGGWAHSYDGAISFVRSFTNGPGGPAGSVANYVNGSGTLNDRIVGSSPLNTQLFVQGTPDGVSIEPAITLRLEKSAKVQKIHISGGEFDFNLFPGQITGVTTVEVGGQSLDLTTVSAGTINFLGIGLDDIVDLTPTQLASVVTDTVVLRKFVFPAITFNQFSITEISVEGTLAPPPATEVAIDIKPGNPNNRINLYAGPEVKVAVLSSPAFNALSVAPSSLTFGHTGDEPSLLRCKAPEDVSGDGMLDLVCEFSIAATGLTASDRAAVLKGRTTAGTAIVGKDAVEVRTQPAAGEVDDYSQN
jgi:hypothetical protein